MIQGIGSLATIKRICNATTHNDILDQWFPAWELGPDKRITRYIWDNTQNYIKFVWYFLNLSFFSSEIRDNSNVLDSKKY